MVEDGIVAKEVDALLRMQVRFTDTEGDLSDLGEPIRRLRLFLWCRSWGGLGFRLLVFLRTRAQGSGTNDQTHQEGEGEFTFHTILVI